MARQVVYEGPDLQQLLQQVIDEHGPARIHPPERRRKGGVLGFFAREVYVITVDVDAPTGAAAAAADRAATPAPGVTSDLTVTQGAMAGRGFGSGSPAGPAQSPLAALVESTEDEAELGGSGTSSAGIVGGDGAGVAASEPPRSPAPEATNGHAGAGPVPEPAGPPHAPMHAAATEVDKPFGQVLSEVASSLGEEPGTYRPDPERLRRPRRPQPVIPAPDLAGAGTPERVPEEEPELDGQRERGPMVVQLPLLQIEGEEPPDLGATIVDLLRAAGFPERLLPLAPLEPELSTVEAVFGALPEPPPLPSEPGGLVAVVGSAGLVRSLANAVALAVGCPRDEVAVASANASDRHARPEYRARTAAQAASMSPGWRRDRVGVVAVYGPPLGADQRWTRQVLRALRPSCVWGMAAGTTKPDDVRRWVSAIGGVDALAVSEVGATATPAAILSLGIPVTRLDDDPATPARWAAVVADLVTKH